MPVRGGALPRDRSAGPVASSATAPMCPATFGSGAPALSFVHFPADQFTGCRTTASAQPGFRVQPSAGTVGFCATVAAQLSHARRGARGPCPPPPITPFGSLGRTRTEFAFDDHVWDQEPGILVSAIDGRAPRIRRTVRGCRPGRIETCLLAHCCLIVPLGKRDPRDSPLTLFIYLRGLHHRARDSRTTAVPDRLALSLLSEQARYPLMMPHVGITWHAAIWPPAGNLSTFILLRAATVETQISWPATCILAFLLFVLVDQSRLRVFPAYLEHSHARACPAWCGATWNVFPVAAIGDKVNVLGGS
jgi:hypothetical protein